MVPIQNVKIDCGSDMEYYWYRNGNYRSRFGPGSGTGWDRNGQRPFFLHQDFRTSCAKSKDGCQHKVCLKLTENRFLTPF